MNESKELHTGLKICIIKSINVQGVPFTTVFFQRHTALLVKIMSDFKNFFTGKPTMN